MILEIKGLLDVSPLMTSPEEIQQGFNEWLKKNVCNFHGHIEVKMVYEVKKDSLEHFSIPESSTKFRTAV